MYHLDQHRALYTRAVPILIASSIVTVPATQAYAMPAESAVGFVAVSSWPSFGIGCAVGAILGGLTMGLVGRSSRRHLKEELDEVMRIAERAEESARRAEELLDEKAREALYGTQTGELSVTGAIDRTAIPSIEAKDVVSDEAHVEQVFETKVLVGRGADLQKQQERDEQPTGVRARLQERLGSNVFNEMPVIDRGQVRETPAPVFAHKEPVQRQFDPAARAQVIDRRIPRFDESLFPDPELDMGHETDMFETAMKAMEDSLSATNPLQDEASVEDQSTHDLESSHSLPEMTDTESYIDYLIQDELERNRSGSARRYSRAHLTMFEGTGDLSAARRTGDLSAARRIATYRPRHMQASSKEA